MNLLLMLLLLMPAIRPETGKFTIYQDGRKLGTEEFTITPQQTGYVIEGRTVLASPAQNVDLKSRMELNLALEPTAYEFQSKGNFIKLRIGEPTSELEYTLDGKKQTDDVRFPKDASIIDTNFFHHYAVLLYRVGAAAGKMTISAVIPQQLEIGALTVTNLGNNTFEIDSGNLKVIATTDKEGRLIRLTVPDAKVVVER
jgi:hypothetical protein